MTSGLAWIIRTCLFVCLWGTCLCNCNTSYNQYLLEMGETLPEDYLFRVRKWNKREETFVGVEKALHRFYGENCNKFLKCEDYNQDNKRTISSEYYSGVFYLLKCLDVKELLCVMPSTVTYSLAEVDLVSVERFKCLVIDALYDKCINGSDPKKCHLFEKCPKATTLDTKTATIHTTALPTINYREVISVSMLLAVSLIANIILLLGVVYLWTRRRHQHKGPSPATSELTVLNTVEPRNLIQMVCSPDPVERNN
ncbi:uncharacterized protein LOC121573765 isoform X2 [Coregonus clupeaformis]|nr:uncharacterized protein LOC121573765 isoform X2 [Coregonus clupeaformis]